MSGPGNAAAGVNPPAFQCPRILTGAHDGRIRYGYFSAMRSVMKCVICTGYGILAPIAANCTSMAKGLAWAKKSWLLPIKDESRDLCLIFAHGTSMYRHLSRPSLTLTWSDSGHLVLCCKLHLAIPSTSLGLYNTYQNLPWFL